ncbi:hypothetical protein MESS2_1440011 [Mesorhizobium metallidurans STM 2683]|uniref:Uncharacterized protein n=1 Tax=Mesorhizobium metallidurans STM 2683 TaxID=1297569 RepID=M5EJI4_9HYPH|nr:hypothetical protein MESS2_1440011 [Mesorhizobium metallidurans STM 2683]
MRICAKASQFQVVCAVRDQLMLHGGLNMLRSNDGPIPIGAGKLLVAHGRHAPFQV